MMIRRDRYEMLEAAIEQALEGIPVDDPGEGDWDDIQTAFGCGELAGQFDVADRIRNILADFSAGFRMVCSACGSENVTGEAHIVWVPDHQQWVLGDVDRQHAWCESCRSTCVIKRVAHGA